MLRGLRKDRVGVQGLAKERRRLRVEKERTLL
jgi:hypothetical protein